MSQAALRWASTAGGRGNLAACVAAGDVSRAPGADCALASLVRLAASRFLTFFRCLASAPTLRAA
eukprot:6705084-Lingulodinium_polyedra.AAC.1